MPFGFYSAVQHSAMWKKNHIFFFKLSIKDLAVVLRFSPTRDLCSTCSKAKKYNNDMQVRVLWSRSRGMLISVLIISEKSQKRRKKHLPPEHNYLSFCIQLFARVTVHQSCNTVRQVGSQRQASQSASFSHELIISSFSRKSRPKESTLYIKKIVGVHWNKNKLMTVV